MKKVYVNSDIKNPSEVVKRFCKTSRHAIDKGLLLTKDDKGNYIIDHAKSTAETEVYAVFAIKDDLSMVYGQE